MTTEMSAEFEDRLSKSWEANAGAWVKAVRDGLIRSRTRATDAAVVQTVIARRPRRVLDLGCGEGWLARALSEHGIETVGIDASEALVQAAQERGGGDFRVCSYAELAASPGRAGRDFDVIVSNFALLHKDVVPLLRALRELLFEPGVLVIQTVHPWRAAAEVYEDRWREERFEEIDAGFRASMPWYYRTMESWVGVLGEAGYILDALHEPAVDRSEGPLSLIMIAAGRKRSG